MKELQPYTCIARLEQFRCNILVSRYLFLLRNLVVLYSVDIFR